MDRRGERIAHFLDFQDRRLQNLVWGKAERRGIIHNRGAAAAWTTARVWKVAEAHVCVKPRMGKGRYHGYTYGFRWRTPPLEQSRLNPSIVGQGYRSLSLYLSFEPGIKLFGARIGGRKEKEESMDEEKANEWEIVASFIWRKKRMNE